MEKNNLLITGGDGFVGSQVAHELHTQGHKVTVVDRKLKHNQAPYTLTQSDYLDFISTDDSGDTFDTIVHLAADHLVEQSVSEPAKYYANNVVKTKLLLDVMVSRGIKNIIFSSSGNTYGRQGKNGALIEDLYYDPENPYASTKVAGELLIKDYARAYGLKFVNFRYFNAGGADPECRFGYVQRPATHVIPILCNKILNGETFTIHGSNYETADGTCVRDYVHVHDLARAHTHALNWLNSGGGNEAFNIGGGSAGVSVKELVNYASKVVGKEPHVVYGPRRTGDPAMLVADISKAAKFLDWSPKYTIQDIIQHAWNWEKKFETDK
jgi:UDP-glucose 4-epimerase